MRRILSIASILTIAFSALFSVSAIHSTTSEIHSNFARTVIVDNSRNPTTLTDYQIFVNVTYDSNMQPDFDDLRFTWDNETSGQEVKISYSLDTYVDSRYALVWVKVPLIRALGQEILHVHYGDPTAVSESNGEETFVFFDDFSTNTTANYQFVKGEGIGENGNMTWNSADGLLELTDNDRSALDATGESSVFVRLKDTLINVTQQTYWIETRAKISGTQHPNHLSIYGFFDYTGDHSTASYICHMRASLSEGSEPRHLLVKCFYPPHTVEFENSSSYSWLKDTWYRWSLATASNGTVFGAFYDDSYKEIRELTGTTVHQQTPYWIGLGHGVNDDVGSTSRYDYIRVRQFTDPEPTTYELSALLKTYQGMLQGDINGDGKVNIVDITIVARQFGKTIEDP